MTWEYGFSTDLLGLVVARATGQTLDAVLQTRLLDPLGMADTGFALADATRLIASVKARLSRRAAAERFGIGVATAIRWVRAFRASGSIQARPQGRRPALASH